MKAAEKEKIMEVLHVQSSTVYRIKLLGPVKGAKLVLQHMHILGKFIKVFKNQSMYITMDWDPTSNSAVKIDTKFLK